MSYETTINFDDPKQKVSVLNAIRVLKGIHRVSIIQYRKRRSDRQNRYYHPCFVKPFADFLRDQGEAITDHEAHEMLKVKFLRRPVVSPSTGELLGYAVRSTTDLNTTEFNDYLDRCAAWLTDMFGIIIPDPSDYYEREDK